MKLTALILTALFLTIGSYAGNIYDVEISNAPLSLEENTQIDLTTLFNYEGSSGETWYVANVELRYKDSAGEVHTIDRDDFISNNINALHTKTFKNVKLSEYAGENDIVNLFAWVEITEADTKKVSICSETYPITIKRNHPPTQAQTPFPADHAEQQEMSVTLQWDAAFDPDGSPVQYRIYFGTFPTLGTQNYKGQTSNTTWQVPALNYRTDYFWRIDTTDGKTLTEGTTWHFKTIGSSPQITQKSPSAPLLNPQQNDQILFSITGSDEDGGLNHAEWYFDDNCIKDQELASTFGNSMFLHTFSTSGSHTITAKMNDIDGNIAEAHWKIEVNTPPTAATNIHASEITEEGALVEWDAAYDQEQDAPSYQIYSGKSRLWGKEWTLHNTTTSTNKTIHGLESDSTYSIKIVADDGNGGQSERIQPDCLKTLPSETVSTPQRPKSTVDPRITMDTTLTFVTKEVLCNHANHHTEYRFDFGDGTSSDWEKKPITKHTFKIPGKFDVTATARCTENRAIISPASKALKVTVQYPKAAQIITVKNRPIDFDGTSYTLGFEVQNNGTDQQNLILVAEEVPNGWDVTPKRKEIFVPHGESNGENFNFLVTPPDNDNSSDQIVWALYYKEDAPQKRNTLLDRYTLPVLNTPRTSTKVVLYKKKGKSIIGNPIILAASRPQEKK